MKILMSTLLFAVVVFRNFNELYAADKPESSSGSDKTDRNPGGRPTGRESRRHGGVIHGEFRIKPYFRQSFVVTGPSWGFLEHMGQRIEVWLDDSRTRIIKADYPGNSCPSGREYQQKNFLVRLATLSGPLQVVEYVDRDGTLMGVRAPRPTNANVMEPNTAQWFIVYAGKYFRVRVNPANKEVESITLASKNENEVAQGRRAEEVDIAGFKFFVIRGPPRSMITGAELPRRPPPPIVVDNFRDLIS